MDLNKLQQKLIATARLHPPSDRVPYAFEKRIMARLASPPARNQDALWVRAMWRAAVCSAAIALLAGAWSLWPASSNSGSSDLAKDFETTVLAGADQASDSW